jgi:hypothetical protein
MADGDSIKRMLDEPTAADLAQAHDQAKASVIRAAARIQKSADEHGTPQDRADSLDRWLRGDLATAFAWRHGIAAAYVLGLADGLAEVGQP